MMLAKKIICDSNFFRLFQGVSLEPDDPRNQAGGEHGSASPQNPVQGTSQRRR